MTKPTVYRHKEVAVMGAIKLPLLNGDTGLFHLANSVSERWVINHGASAKEASTLQHHTR